MKAESDYGDSRRRGDRAASGVLIQPQRHRQSEERRQLRDQVSRSEPFPLQAYLPICPYPSSNALVQQFVLGMLSVKHGALRVHPPGSGVIFLNWCPQEPVRAVTAPRNQDLGRPQTEQLLYVLRTFPTSLLDRKLAIDGSQL